MTDVFSHPSYDNHEQVLFVSDEESGLKGIIGIHSTALGPAAGGCRMYPYMSTEDALKDVLRLSRGMTMKNSATGIPVGGGKCVIIGDPNSPQKEARLRAMARHVQRLGGSYWTAIDVGVSAEDADTMAEECDYIFARASQFETDFPPAKFTSTGGFHGVRAATTFLRGSDDMTGLRVAVQGVGQTGADLIAQMSARGADIVATDVNKEALARMVSDFGVTAVAPNEIYAQDVDVFAPCAMGGILNDDTLPQLKCKAIAGLANNQLETPAHGQRLLDMGIAYAPDFIVNGGGITACAMPIFTTFNKQDGLKRVEAIYDVTLDILQRSMAEGTPSELLAEKIAMGRIAQAKAA
ncbi:leucine dehydrogenase [Ruegeria litorea]|uniref:Leucine dehydrogenase n=1 Tax=Falsiruegeria litorea TaxID=1280831 RepID=A0ABS5WKH3_9RHOB|nr:Glu/Leu/Phe/Val dehydrogenase dimerization domain-containing protein [Falsiruegeria litorea]MBT3139493.1 leucine dehydrogenase [Falsiruegeria litorea]